MPSLLPRSKKARTALIVIASIVVIGVVAGLLAGSSGSKKKKSGRHTTTTSLAPTSALKLAVGLVKVQSTGTTAKLPSSVQRTVLQAAQTYVNDAVIAPLKSGHVDDGYVKIFGLSLRPAASGPDRGALTEAKTGAAKGKMSSTASRVRIDGLGDPTGKIALVATTFTLTVAATTPTGPLVIHRNTALTFENQFGSWVVTAYDVGVLRSGGATTSAAHASAGGAGGHGGAA